jgi:hypothetical protein
LIFATINPTPPIPSIEATLVNTISLHPPFPEAVASLDLVDFADLISAMTAIPEAISREIVRSWAMHLAIHGALPQRTDPTDLCRCCLERHFKRLEDCPSLEGFFSHELEHLDQWLPFKQDMILAVLSALMRCIGNAGISSPQITTEHCSWSSSLGEMEGDDLEDVPF